MHYLITSPSLEVIVSEGCRIHMDGVGACGFGKLGSWEVTEKENRLSMGRQSLDFSAGGYGVSQFFGEGTLMDV
jgi:hypothetical protein